MVFAYEVGYKKWFAVGSRKFFYVLPIFLGIVGCAYGVFMIYAAGA